MVEAGDSTPHLHLLLGKAYLALGENDKAEEELKDAAAGDRVPFAHYYLGVLNRQLSRPELAATEFEKEIRIDPTNAMAARELAEVRLDEADPQSAVAVLEKAIAGNHDAPELFATLGRAYLQTSNETRAIAVLKKAIALSPDVSSYHYQLGRAYLKAGRSVQAHTEMERARTLSARVPQGKMQALSGDREPEPTPDGSH
jgi:tetratricopeptide (TPR) repeat protein